MSTMSAITYYPPGGSEKLQYGRVDVPKDLEPTEVLIKVHAASVIWPELTWPIYQHSETGDYHSHIPCHDFSGTVVRTGSDVEGQSDLRVGSEVYAFTTKMKANGLRKWEGAAAEYAVADVQSALPKPKNLDLLHAATVPLSALTAWQAIHDQSTLRKGQRLLVTGAGGATGLWAVQFAKQMGAYVVGTASSEWSFAVLKELGIDEIIDYKKQELAETVSNIDVVLDTVGGQSFDSTVKVIKPEGQILSIVEYGAAERVPKGVNAKFFIVDMNREQLNKITELTEDGKLRTFVDSVYPLEKAVEAFKKGKQGHLRGKVVLSVAS